LNSRILSGADDSLKNDLDLLLGLTDQQRTAIVSWLRKNGGHSQLSWAELNSLSHTLGLDSGEVARAVFFAKFVLSNWESSNLGIEELEADFKSLKVNESDLPKAAAFFSELSDTRKDVQAGYLEAIYEKLGLPTIDDINLLWDIRPVFKEFAYSQNENDDYAKLLRHSFILIVEIISTRTDGNNETAAYQFSVAEFENFVQGIKRAQDQLGALQKAYAQPPQS
jgi:hypothetical protein